jgi:hypothetical protein
MHRKTVFLAICFLLILAIGVLVLPGLFIEPNRPAQATPASGNQVIEPPPAAAEVASDLVPGQSKEPSPPVCVDLKKFFTASLTDSLNSPTSVKSNNLAELPIGRQTFGEVPFEVGGIVQLTGTKLQEWGRKEFPAAVRDIPVGMRGRFVHLLHGAGGVFDRDGETIATLVLHYSDQSTNEIGIQAGLHVSDWWGNPRQQPRARNSALIWTGKNEAIRNYSPKDSLRLFLTSFENPRPDLAIERVDYLSALKNASPFLLGLTLSDTAATAGGRELNSAR